MSLQFYQNSMIRQNEMKSKEQSRSGSIDWTIVKEALRRALPPDEKQRGGAGLSSQNHDVEISVLINDVFGGEIVRTRNRRGWHLSNRINGERVDLARQDETSSSDNYTFGQSSDTTAETSGYYEQNDYTTFFLRFVTALEEAVGLGKYQTA
jgi:hypothetical protein